jgi:Ras-related GTP-binding protein C/D
VDGLSDDRKSEAQRDIHRRATDDLADAGLEGIHLSFYLTSIYDHSIFEVGGTVGLKCVGMEGITPLILCLLHIGSGWGWRVSQVGGSPCHRAGSNTDV